MKQYCYIQIDIIKNVEPLMSVTNPAKGLTAYTDKKNLTGKINVINEEYESEEFGERSDRGRRGAYALAGFSHAVRF